MSYVLCFFSSFFRSFCRSSFIYLCIPSFLSFFLYFHFALFLSFIHFSSFVYLFPFLIYFVISESLFMSFVLCFLCSFQILITFMYSLPSVALLSAFFLFVCFSFFLFYVCLYFVVFLFLFLSFIFPFIFFSLLLFCIFSGFLFPSKCLYVFLYNYFQYSN